MISAPAVSSVQTSSVRPPSTATRRFGSQWFDSRSQTSFMLAGQTTTVGNASSDSIVASA